MKSEEKGKGEQGDPEGIAVRRRFIGGRGGERKRGGEGGRLALISNVSDGKIKALNEA